MNIQRLSLCNKCGSCCRALFIEGYSPEEWLERVNSPLSNGDWEFARDHWKVIPTEEAIQINPMLQLWVDKRQLKKFVTLVCDGVTEENLCKYYETRPYCCSGYPFYDRIATLIKSDELLYNKECGYEALRIPSNENYNEQFSLTQDLIK